MNPPEHHMAAAWTLLGFLALACGPMVYGALIAKYLDTTRKYALRIFYPAAAWSIFLLATAYFSGYIDALVDWMNYGR